MAGSLVESLAADFDPSAFHDEYREAVLALLDRKLAGEDVIVPEPVVQSDDTGTVVDLMAALQESVRRSRAGSGGTAAPADEDEDEPAPKATAKRAPAKKTAHRKTGT